MKQRLVLVQSRLAIVAFAIIALAGLPASPADASLPGKPFTQTQCEGYSDSVVRLYTAGLGREPEQDGFDFWMTEYTSGRWSFPAMAAFFVESPEFISSYGDLDQDGFIRQIYRNVLGREGEAGGVAYWNSQMTAGVSRATVLMRFAESPENIEATGTTQPTAGEFNEGRIGPWRCGPDLSAALLTAADLPAGWVASATTISAQPAGVTFCESLLWFPVESHSGRLVNSTTSEFGAQAIYPYPTEAGAKAYLTHARDGVPQCATYTASGAITTIEVLSIAQYGDESLALSLTRTEDDGTISASHLLVIRTGAVLNGFQLGGPSAPSVSVFTGLADVAHQRLTNVLNG